MEVLKGINIGVRFLLELCLVWALGYAGYHLTNSLILKWTLMLGLPVAAAIVWGAYIAPKAGHLLDLPQRAVVELALFGIAAVLLFVVGQKGLSLAFAAAVIINETFLLVWRQ